MNKKLGLHIVVLAVFALFLAACGGDAETVEVTRIVEVTRVVEVAGEGGGDTLATVQDRGFLVCASNASSPGFGFLDENGVYSGFDFDFCRAVAAAVFGDSEKVEVRPTTAIERFPVLQSGEADVLINATTWTISRDSSLGFDFAPTTFYDGQGMMVRKDSGLTTLEDFEDSTICVQAGTTTEKNLADTLRQLGINAESVVFPDTPSTTQAYDEGRCDGLSSGNLQEVEVSLLDKAEDVWRLYQNDELDCIYLTPIFSPGRLEHARQRCPDQYLSGPTPSNIFLVLDITRPPFNNLFVRQALAMAIDKETLANVTLTGLYPPATGGFVLPGMPGHVTGIGYSHNLKQARELLAHVGYPGGRGFPTVIARVLDANIYRIISRALHIMWQENLEINIEFEPMSPEIRGHIYLTGTAPDYLDPDTFLRVNNWSPETGWQHPAFDRLVEQARRIADQEERLAMYRQAEEILSEQAVLLPLLYGRFHMMLKPWLLKYPVSPMFVPYWKDAILETH